MATDYHKKVDTVCLSDRKFSAETTKGEMRKRGVDKDTCRRIPNRVVETTLKRFYETSGEVEYGMSVDLECLFEDGGTVKTTVSGMDYLSWVQTHELIDGKMGGDFLFLFQGVVERLVERGGAAHQNFLDAYQRQEEQKKVSQELVVKRGDIVNIYGGAVYLGEFYYYKPNLTTPDLYVKLKKYKVYIDWRRTDGEFGDYIYVESGKTKQNQVTEILGHVDVDMEQLKDWAFERVASMEEKEVGWTINGYFRSHRAYESVNNKAYVLLNMQEKKEDATPPLEEDILRMGWLCGWRMKEGVVDIISREWYSRDSEPKRLERVKR